MTSSDDYGRIGWRQHAPGFQADHVLTGTISLPWKAYPELPSRLTFLERLDAALRVQPGVTAVGFTSGLPFAGNDNNSAVGVEGVQLAPGESIRTHYTSFAMGDYWRALGIPLLEGRLLEDPDNHRERRVCVVDADFARRYWPGKSALLHRIAQDITVNDKNAFTIVGVVGAWAAGRAMQSVLFGVGSLDPAVLAATAATMIVAVLFATFIPSRRATRVSPMEALRAE